MNGPKRVLVIDDEKVMARLVAGILSRQGYETQSVSSVAEALNLMSQQAYHLITCDLMLPEISGMDLLKMMNGGSLQPATPVMLITGLANDESLAEARALGAVNILTKPFTPQQLIEAASEVLQSS